MLLAADEKAYRISVKPWGPGFATPALPATVITATAVPISTTNGVVRMKTEAIFISNASIFFPRYSGVLPIINPAMNTPRTANISIEYMPVPTPPGATSPEFDQQQRHESAERRHRVVHRVDRTAGGGGGDGGEERRGGNAEAGLLALHVAARLQGARDLVDALLRNQRVAELLAVERQ